jgi:hypothetical protein
MRRVAIISDKFAGFGLALPDTEFDVVGAGEMPLPERLANADLALVFGPLEHADRAMAMGGVIRLALERGATVCFLYQEGLSPADTRFFDHSHALPFVEGPDSLRPAETAVGLHPAFSDYAIRYGRSRLMIADREVGHGLFLLGGTKQPSAIAVPVGKGTLYVLPYHVPAGFDQFLTLLLSSIEEHAQGIGAELPAFLGELRVPGETDVLGELERLRQDVVEFEAKRATLEHHKLLLGHLSGTALEELIIEELNLVLDGSGLVARDVAEQFTEDFEVYDVESDDRIALGESKAETGGVKLENVNQINNFRSSLDLGVPEMPGLVVVNAFRNDASLNRRHEPVPARAVQHARAMNVLIMRTWDVYGLVVRCLAGENDADAFREALTGGGGWLEAGNAAIPEWHRGE